MWLDLERPLLVITGAWNPAIFQPPWTAVNLLGYAEGQQVMMMQVLTERPPPLNYFGNLGIGVTAQRLELYANTFDDETKRSLEGLAGRIIEVLPHTPIAAFGINFIFHIPEPDAELVDKLKTHERLETEFRVSEQKFLAKIILDDVQLNLSREISADSFTVNFNFNHEKLSANGIRDVVPNCLDVFYKRAIEVLKQLYGEFEIEFRGRTFPADPATGD